jgi:hypothetical protein
MYAYSKNENFGVIVNVIGPAGLSANVPLDSGEGRHAAEHRRDGLNREGPAVNPRQAKSGPGLFPPEDTYTPQGEIGAGYARADTCITRIIPGGGSFCPANIQANVAEVFRATAGSAHAEADVLATYLVSIDPGEDLNIAAVFTPAMRVHTTGDREIAVSTIFSLLAVLTVDTAETLFSWAPCGDPADSDCRFRDPSVTVFDILDPFSLNESLRCAGFCEKTYGSGEGRFEITVRGLGGTEGRDLRLLVAFTETADVFIPEPHPLSLLLLGATGLAVFATKRKLAG